MLGHVLVSLNPGSGYSWSQKHWLSPFQLFPAAPSSQQKSGTLPAFLLCLHTAKEFDKFWCWFKDELYLLWDNGLTIGSNNDGLQNIFSIQVRQLLQVWVWDVSKCFQVFHLGGLEDVHPSTSLLASHHFVIPRQVHVPANCTNVTRCTIQFIQ